MATYLDKVLKEVSELYFRITRGTPPLRYEDGPGRQ